MASFSGGVCAGELCLGSDCVLCKYALRHLFIRKRLVDPGVNLEIALGSSAFHRLAGTGWPLAKSVSAQSAWVELKTNQGCRQFLLSCDNITTIRCVCQ